MGNHLCSCYSGEDQVSEELSPPSRDSIKALTSSLIQVRQRIQERANSSPDLSLNLHPSKCRCLAQSYVDLMGEVLERMKGAAAANRLDSSSSSLWKKLEASLRALFHAMEEGDKFLDDCKYRGQEKWLEEKAFGLLSSTDIVDTHLHDLVWCISAVNEALKQLEDQEGEDRSGRDYRLLLQNIWTSAEGMEGEDMSAARGVLAEAPKGQGENCNRLAEFFCRRFCMEPDHAIPWEDPEGFRRGNEALGKGSFAEIFDVEWMGGRFAIKEFFHVDDDALFRREADVQAKLRHPNVLHLVCCTRSSSVANKCSLVTELMHQDLRNLIIQRKRASSPPFPLLAAVDMMLQIAKGMEYLHGQRIMHRDLKSSNILVSRPCSPASYLDKSGHVKVKIADFGMAKVKQTSSMYTTKNAGTTFWRAPEVFDIGPEEEVAQNRYTKKADVYSFALVCFEILTGESPFEDYQYKRQKLYDSLMRGERPSLPPISCPLAISSFIKDCWDGDPRMRPTFRQICKQLRYFKACILLDEEERLSRPWQQQDQNDNGDQSNKVNEYDRVFNIPVDMCRCWGHHNPSTPL